ncbi:MocR-like transcription factor YczR [Nakamurella alba]|nr:PLP-dependent aminotransferase family protein [Nakamurella alba]
MSVQQTHSTPSIRLSATSLVRRLGTEPLDGPGPAYRALAYRIRSAVLDGRLAVDSGLPSERELASGLSLSRTTVAAAYTLLREDGWIDSRRGSGSTLRLPAAATGSSRDLVRPQPVTGPAGIFGYPHLDPEEGIDLTTACLPGAEEPVLRALEAATAQLPRYLASDGYSPLGLPVLRAAIAARYTAAGLPTTADQILVTNGAQHAFSLCLQELSAPGDRVLMECPTYPVALDAVRAARRSPAPFGLEHRTDGGSPWDMELLATTLRQTAPRLAYLIPDFHNPTGALMSEADRRQLVAAARAAGTVLLIDESFREVGFAATDLPLPVAAFGDDSRVISLGSVSKAFWGGLRVGWVRAAPALIDRLAAARSRGDMSGPVLEQLIVAELLAAPDEALARQRERLAHRSAELLAAIADLAPDWRPTTPHGGATLWVQLPQPCSGELALLAPTVGLRLAPGPRFGPDGTLESFLRIPFTQSPERLREAVRRIVDLLPQAGNARRVGVSGFLA